MNKYAIHVPEKEYMEIKEYILKRSTVQSVRSMAKEMGVEYSCIWSLVAGKSKIPTNSTFERMKKWYEKRVNL